MFRKLGQEHDQEKQRPGFGKIMLPQHLGRAMTIHALADQAGCSSSSPMPATRSMPTGPARKAAATPRCGANRRPARDPRRTRPAANETRGERDPRGRPDILAGEHAGIAVRISEDHLNDYATGGHVDIKTNRSHDAGIGFLRLARLVAKDTVDVFLRTHDQPDARRQRAGQGSELDASRLPPPTRKPALAR